MCPHLTLAKPCEAAEALRRALKPRPPSSVARQWMTLDDLPYKGSAGQPLTHLPTCT